MVLLRCRNKSKYEYTLQGWKAFALSHSVQTGDRLQIELLPDSRRMRADIVKRAELKERVASDPGPESPILPDMASAAKRQHAAGATLPQPKLLFNHEPSALTRNPSFCRSWSVSDLTPSGLLACQCTAPTSSCMKAK